MYFKLPKRNDSHAAEPYLVSAAALAYLGDCVIELRAGAPCGARNILLA